MDSCFTEKDCTYHLGNFDEHYCTTSTTHRLRAHLGARKTASRISRQYYWPDLRKTVLHYINTCDVSQRTEAPRHLPNGYLKSLPVPHGWWQDISVEFIKPLPRTRRGDDGVFVVVDRFSKMMHVVPIPRHCDSLIIAKLFHKHIYRAHGLPKTITRDRDPFFMGRFWEAPMKLLHVRICASSSHHPETDGQTDIVSRKIEESLSVCVGEIQDNWDE